MHRLRSDLLVSSVIKAAQSLGAFVLIRSKGHEEAGIIFLWLQNGPKSSVFVEHYTDTGDLKWRPRLLDSDEASCEALIKKEQNFDPDLWVIEVEGACEIDDLPGSGVIEL